jgi:DNA-binding transcriptional regulator/RsmH inhibitor MraZ
VLEKIFLSDIDKKGKYIVPVKFNDFIEWTNKNPIYLKGGGSKDEHKVKQIRDKKHSFGEY